MSTAPSQVTAIKGLRLASLCLIVVPLASLMVLAHHPVVAAHDVHDALEQLKGVARFAAVVHGLLIAGQCAILHALLTWLGFRGMENTLPRAAAMMFLLGTVGVVGAALVDGFIVAPLALYPHASDPGLAMTDQLIRYSMSLNQVLIMAGECALSAAIVWLSLDLLAFRRGGRWLGVVGVALGVSSLVALLAGWLVLHLGGMQTLYAAQSVWLLWLGVSMFRYSAGPGNLEMNVPAGHATASGQGSP